MSAVLLRGVLFVGAHPDDETIMAGGTLALLHAQSVATHVLCITDGRGGESGTVAEADTPQARAAVRERELSCAVASLGVGSLTLLGYEDPVIGPGDELYGFAADEDTLVTQIATVIRRTGVQTVLTHGTDGEYGHPAHVQVHRVTLRAVREQTPTVAVYGVAALVPTIEDRLWNQSDPAHLALDITPWAEAKIAAMECHRTQHELFKRRLKLTEVRDALRRVEAFHRHWPPLPAGDAPGDTFAALLRQAGAWQPDHGT